MPSKDRLAAMRRAILREWRDEEEEHPDARLHAAGEFVKAILERAGAAEGIEEERLREMWREVAGEMVSRHAAPFSLRNGCLTLTVLQPAMRVHLEQMKGMLLKRLQAAAGEGVVKSIRLTLG